ncbi:MAG: cupin domain-containing protein [Nanoarchaeota archaeon]
MEGRNNGEGILGTLNVRGPDNVAKQGRLVEIFRGGDEFRRTLGGLEQETDHFPLPGEVGGNHYHEKKVEIIYLRTGTLTVYLQDPKTKKVYSREIQAAAKFTLLPGIAHALVNSGNTPCNFTEHSSLAFNPRDSTNDVHKLEGYSLVPNQQQNQP